MTDAKLSLGAQYLHDRIKQADHTVALLLDQIEAKDKRIAELEKNQRKTKAT